MDLFKSRGYVPGGVVRNRREEDFDVHALPPFLRTLLVADGTVTKSLEAFFWEEIRVETIDQHDVVLDAPLPELSMTAGQHALQRLVRLRGQESNRVYACAKSYLSLSVLDAELKEALLSGRIGIGELLRESGLESYREILDMGLMAVGALDEDLRRELAEPVAYRSYRIKVHAEPTIWINEYFPLACYTG